MTNGTVEGAHAGLYGVKRFGPFYLAAAGDYGHFYNKTERFIDWVVDERAVGKFTSDVFSARLEGGWKHSFGGVNVTPFAGLQVAHYKSDGFAEVSERTSGGPGILGLTFGSNSVNSLARSLGIQLDTRIALANGQTLTPFARVAWVHEYHPDRNVNSSLTMSPVLAFSPQGASTASDAAKVNAGLRLDVARGIGLFTSFDGEFSGHSHGYTGNAGVKIIW